MASGSSGFLYEDEIDTVIIVIDADMLQNNEEMNPEINSCIKDIYY